MLIERILFRVHLHCCHFEVGLFCTYYLCLSEKILIARGVEALLSGVSFKEDKDPTRDKCEPCCGLSITQN